MQAELQESHPELNISLLSINKIAAESGVASFNTTHNLPMVQDETALGILSDWGAVWRDVYILNENNELVLVYNLTQYSLSDSNNYNTLMQHFIDTAQP